MSSRRCPIRTRRSGLWPDTVRLKREDVERMMSERPAGTGLEEALEVFEVFASGTGVLPDTAVIQAQP